MSSAPTGGPVQKVRTWTDEHERFARELSIWIPQPDIRDLIIAKVRERFGREQKAVGDLQRWLMRAIQDAFFLERLAGNGWSDEHQGFAQWCTAWITDDEIRSQAISFLRVSFEKLKKLPKKPSYWIPRITNRTYRNECKQRGLSMANH
jgi:hypothetical protein